MKIHKCDNPEVRKGENGDKDQVDPEDGEDIEVQATEEEPECDSSENRNGGIGDGSEKGVQGK